MKLGVATMTLHFFEDLGMDFTQMLDWVVDQGLDAVEFNTGTFHTVPRYFMPEKLLFDEHALTEFKNAVDARGLVISGLSCHGNPLHPDHAIADRSHRVFEQTVEVAERLGVRVVILFSGCPGDGPEARRPNWVTSAYPPEFQDILHWQWSERIIPYWQRAGTIAESHGVQIALEMHPGFSVYNPGTLLRLRDAVGPVIGANIDTAHLFEQMIDPIEAVKTLGEAVLHVHAKDTSFDANTLAVHGIFDLTAQDRRKGPYGALASRPFLARTIGYGHDSTWWKKFVTSLRLTGYEGVLSIEQADRLASIPEGMAKSIALLKDAILREPGWGIEIPPTQGIPGSV